MSGQSISWILADGFKDIFTPGLLTSLMTSDEVRRSAGRPLILHPSGLPPIEVKMCTGLRCRRSASVFLRQWKTARLLSRQGVALRRPVAIGLKQRLGFLVGAYQVIEIIPESVPLQEFLNRHGPRPRGIKLPENRDLADLLNALAVQIRKVCVLGSDFSLEDVLIRVAEDGTPSLFVGDPGKMQQKRATTGRARIDDMLMLDAMLWGRAPSREQMLFMQMYLRRLTGWREFCMQALRRLRDTVGEIRLPGRFCRQSENMQKFTLRGVRGFMKRGDHEAGLVKLLEHPDGLFDRPEAAILKDSRTSSALILRAPELPWPIYLKRYNCKGPVFAVQYMALRSRAQRAWQVARELREQGVPTPEPLAFLERRRFGHLRAGYFCTQAFPGAEGLDQYVARRFPGWTAHEKRTFIQRLASQLRAVHQRGVLHGDLKAKNILVVPGPEGEESMLLVDLDAVRRRRRPSLHDTCRDLARLNCSFLDTALVSRTQRLAFLQHYMEAESRAALQKAWAQTLELTWRKLLQSGRHFTG